MGSEDGERIGGRDGRPEALLEERSQPNDSFAASAPRR